MRLTLTRFKRTPQATFGKIEADGEFICYSLEDVVRPFGQKVPGKTAIPAGTYPVQITFSPRFKQRMPLLIGVPDFTGIRIHPGNTSEHTEGCILPGTTITDDDWIGESRKAYQDLFSLIEDALDCGESVFIDVVNAFDHA